MTQEEGGLHQWLQVRMSKPVLPGQTLVTEMWQEGETVSVAKVKEKVKESRCRLFLPPKCPRLERVA